MKCRLNLIYRLFTRSLAHSARPMWSRCVLLLIMWCAMLEAQTAAAPHTPPSTATPAKTGPRGLVTPPPPPATTRTAAGIAAAQPTLTPESAMHLALLQASAYQQAVIDEQTAALELTQSRAALLPKLRSTSTVIYNKPLHPFTQDPAFIAQNASREYQELAGVEGSLDFGLRAAINRNRALLAAAHAGTEIARRALIRGTREAYFGLALATAKRRSAEESLAAAGELQRVTTLQQHGGEVPEVDVIRARLQSAQRRDDLEQARLQQTNAAAGLRVLVGFPATQALDISGLTSHPSTADIERFVADAATRRPEILQAEAQLRAARADVGVARAGRLPTLTYSVDEGFDSPSLNREEIRPHRGDLATANLNIPIFDCGVGRARQRQPRLRAELARNLLVLAQRGVEQQFLVARGSALPAVPPVDNARQ